MDTLTAVPLIDQTSDAFAKRLGSLLLGTRKVAGLGVGPLARASRGNFSRDDLRRLEAGTFPLVDGVAERVACLYGADLAAILPERLPVVVGSSTISVGATTVPFTPDDSMSLLTAYLLLVRALRGQERAQSVVVRRDDVERLADALDMAGPFVLDKLASLMGATRTQRSAMAALFSSGAVVVGLVA